MVSSPIELLRRLSFTLSSSMLVSLVHIHVEAYIFTLSKLEDPVTRVLVAKSDVPIDAGTRDTHSDSLTSEAALFENANIPRFQACAT